MFFSPATEQEPEKKSLGSINADQLNSSQQIVPVTYFAGQRYIAGQFISPCYNQVNERVQVKSGKDSSTTAGYIYYADFGILFAMGGRQPVDALFKVIVDAEIVWENEAGLWRDADPYEAVTIPEFGTFYLYWGTNDQPVDTHIFAPRGVVPVDPDFDPRDDETWPKVTGAGITNPVAGHYDRHGRYPAQSWAAFRKWKLGRDRTQVGAIMLELRRGVPWFDGAAVDRATMGLDSDARGVNPVGVFYDLVTDPNTGLRRPDSELRYAGFAAALIRFKDLRISPIITSQMSAKAALTKVLLHMDGFPREWEGLLDIGWWEHGPIDLESVPVLTDDDLDGDPSGLKPSGYLSSDTDFFISYRDREHHYTQQPQKYDDPNIRAILGETRQVIVERDWITDPTLAKNYITEYGTMMTAPKQEGPLPVKREWLDFAFPPENGPAEGNVFLFNSASKGFSILLRLNEYELPEDRDGRANLEVENERGYWPALYYPPPDNRLGIFKREPVAVEDARIIDVPAALKSDVLLQVSVIAARPSHRIVAFSPWTSIDGTDYARLVPRLEFGVHGKIKDEEYPDDTDVIDIAVGFVCELYGPDLETIEALSDQQRDDLHGLIWIGNEIMSWGNIEALGDGKFRVYPRRKVYDTIQTAHPIDSDCWFIFRDHFQPLSHASFVNGATRHFKLQPFNEARELDLSDVVAIDHTFPALPPDLLAPFALKVSRLYRDDLIIPHEAHVVFTWDYALEQDVVSFDVSWRAGGITGLIGDWDQVNVGATNVIIYDPVGVATVKRQSLDLMVGPSNLNYQIRVRAIDRAGVPSDWSGSLSRRAVASTTPDPNKFLHFTSKAELQAYSIANLNEGDIVFVTINNATQYRQLQAGAPAATSDWSVLDQPAMRWRKTGGT